MNAQIEQFRALASFVARDYFLPGADREDVEQEAMIGVFKGLRDYREGVGMTLRSFVELCVRRQIINAVRTATSGKHELLTLSARSVVNEEGERIDAAAMFPDEKADPVEILSQREEVRRILSIVRDGLSPLERHALIGFANGLTYTEIAAELDLPLTDRDGYQHAKGIDNALMRARGKLAA